MVADPRGTIHDRRDPAPSLSGDDLTRIWQRYHAGTISIPEAQRLREYVERLQERAKAEGRLEDATRLRILRRGIEGTVYLLRHGEPLEA